MRALTLALCLTLTPLAALAHEDGHGHDHANHSDHLAEAKGVRLIDAWTNATRDEVTRVFIEIENTSQTDIVLTGGDAEIAATVRLMGAPIQAGATEPVEIGGFFVPISAEAYIETFLLVQDPADCPFCGNGVYGPIVEVRMRHPLPDLPEFAPLSLRGDLVLIDDPETFQVYRLDDAVRLDGD